MPKRKKGRKPLRSSPRVQPQQSPIMLDDAEPNPEPQTQSPDQAEPSPPQRAPDELEETHDMLSTPAPVAPPVPDLVVPEVPNLPPTARKNPGGKRKKPGPGKKRLAEIQEKLSFLNQNIRLVPFAPSRTLDVSRHERLLRALGLWDFAHLQFDTDVRADLLALFIANYDPPSRRSSVRGKRIAVSRADLARALSLPVKKDKTGQADGKEAELELFSGEEAVGAMTDFVMNWVLFQADAWILPKEVVAATQLVKEGQPHKVDWAGLMWTLVEKELLEAPKTGECYYASHLQCLMKHQRPELFLEEPKAELVLEPEAEPEVEQEQEQEREREQEQEQEEEQEQEQEQEPSMELAPVEEEEDADDGADAKTKGLEDIQDMGEENRGLGLTLGLAGDTDVMDGLEECKGGQGEQWLSEGKNVGLEHCLRRCTMNDIESMECDNLIKEEEVKEGREEGRYGDDLATKFSSLERLTSSDLLQAMEAVNGPYGSTSDPYTAQVHPGIQDTEEFLAMRIDTQKNVALDTGLGGSPLYQNDGKRGISDIDDDDEDVHRFVQGNHQQKRMRSDGHWEHATSSFDICMGHLQSWMGRAKMLYAEKERDCTSAQLEIQFLNDMLQQKDQIINSLEKTRLEEQQRRDLEFCRFEHELRVMSRLVLGYKKALRETRTAFADYRKRFPQGEEPLYKDVPGSGGLVLSTRELERQRLQKEQEMRQAADEMINTFQKEWFSKLNGYCELLYGLSKRLVEFDKQVHHMKEVLAQSKCSDT